MEEKNEKKGRKKLSTIVGIFRTLFFILLIVFILAVCLQRFSGNKLSFFNYRMFTVISGSMEPKYSIGDVLISKEVDASKIKVGDTISYLGEKGSFNGKVITHQVTSIKQDENGKYIFRARGLANLVEDPTIYEEQLYGKVIYKVFLLSFVYKIVGTKAGFFLFIIIPIAVIIGAEIISTMLEREKRRRNNYKANKEE